MNIKEDKKIYVSIAASILLFIIVIISSGCSIQGIIEETYMSQDYIKEVPYVDIDEDEIKRMAYADGEMKESYEADESIILEEEDIRNIFEPFYLEDEKEDAEEKKDLLRLDKIYSENEVNYTELKLNDYLYRLKEGDIFGTIYQVQVINSTSVVLLKGDEIITIFIGEVYYN